MHDHSSLIEKSNSSPSLFVTEINRFLKNKYHSLPQAIHVYAKPEEEVLGWDTCVKGGH